MKSVGHMACMGFSNETKGKETTLEDSYSENPKQMQKCYQNFYYSLF
jgi:hypothetical protein